MKETNNSESISLYDLPFSNRAINIFRRININTIQELITYSVADLNRYRNCGKGTVVEIVTVLGRMGFSLRKTSILKQGPITKEALLDKLEKIRTLLELIEDSIKTS